MGILFAALTHRSPLSRSFAAAAIALVLWVAAWVASYALLAEGALRDVLTSRIPEHVFKAGPSLAVTIFGWNLVFGIGMIVSASFFAIGRMSLGYIAPWWWAIGYGVALGTNSFVVTTPGKIAPRVDVLWQHIGAPEVLAYLLVAAALADIHLWRPRRWYSLALSRVRGIADIRLGAAEFGCVAAALVLLFWTANREAAGVIAFLK
jgi:hypothetical protein